MWKTIWEFLGKTQWMGIGVLIAILALLSNVATMFGEDPDPFVPDETVKSYTPSENTNSGRADLLTSVQDSVRCRGGGDFLGRERNRKSKIVNVSLPASATVANAEIEEMKVNYGFASILQDPLRMVIKCDPPNYPGAPGGWMQARLDVYYTLPE